MLFPFISAQESMSKHPLGKELIELGVRQRHDGSFLGLLVKGEYANRFIEGPEGQRKLMEVRNRKLQFLTRGEKLVLIRMTPGQNRVNVREAIAVLSFCHCIEVPVDHFARYYPMHKVTQAEFDSLGKSSQTWFGWQFELTYIFPTPLVLSVKTGEVWIYFKPTDVQTLQVEVAESNLQGVKRDLPEASSDRVEVKNAKCPKTTLAKDTEDDEDFAFSLEDDEAAPSAGLPTQGKMMALLLSEKEYNGLFTGKACMVVRPFQSTDSRLCVVLPKTSGHVAAGFVIVENSFRVDWNSKDAFDVCKAVYTNEQIDSMKKNKTAWFWTIDTLETFPKPLAVGFLDLAPRFRNRPFQMSVDGLDVKIPEKLPAKHNLQETAAYFCQMLSAEHQKLLVSTFKKMAQKRKIIRVGTTCSGSDICVVVLRETLKWFNHTQAQMSWNKPITSCFRKMCN